MTGDHPELPTERLRLRGFVADDLPYLQAFAVRPAFWRYLPGPEMSADLVEAFLAARLASPSNSDWHFCLEHAGLGLPIGTARFTIASPEHRQGNIAVSLDSDHWGQGYAREALAALARFGFEDLGLHRLAALTDTENLPAQKMLAACGFRREGLLRGNFRVRGGWRDSLLYARLESDA